MKDERKLNEAMEKARKGYRQDESIMVETNRAMQKKDDDHSSVVIKPLEKPLGSEELMTYEQRSAKAMELVDDIVLKNYLTKLERMELVAPLEANTMSNNDFILFKINKMVYEKDEYATDKFISVVNAMTYAKCSVCLIVDGQNNHTDFYLGVKGEDENRTSASIATTFENAIKGQFPGILISDMSRIAGNAKCSKQEQLMDKIKEATAFSSYAGIPANRNSQSEYTNANFIQGIEKFATAMHGHRYTAIIMASSASPQEIFSIRSSYENIYTDLSAMATQQLAYSTNESIANALSRTKGNSYTYTQGETIGSSTSKTTSTTSTHTEGESHSSTKGESKDNAAGKLAKAIPLVGRFFNFGAKNLSKSETDSTSSSDSIAHGTSDTVSENKSSNKSESVGKNNSETVSSTLQSGSSKNFTITVQNKHIQEVLKRIDKQLERIETSESSGLWSVGTYFLAYDTDNAIAETAASIFRSIMQGEQSGVEISAINSWMNDGSKELVKYATLLTHPTFIYDTVVDNKKVELTPTSMLSSKEVAMMIGLPRKSVPGLPVVDHISLSKEVVKLGDKTEGNKLSLGCVFDQGKSLIGNHVELDVKSLTQHTFVTGSTGCGKSNTIYNIINEIYENKLANFLVIEPAKGEYKNIFGGLTDVNVYGTNPQLMPLLKINPFRFNPQVHILEHIDRLVEIFNACWPMYAAMPAVLKNAMIKAYEYCGWNLTTSENIYSSSIFPTFTDILEVLPIIIKKSSYSDDTKGDYIGSLVTRVESLTNGINGMIFSNDEIGDEKLFDENVIVDLSRIGSQETKALIMGIIIMRLTEYRSSCNIGANSSLRHVTILEEAHNLLKRCSNEQSQESSNLAGKSVEMISNAIAEMRTYGEGFIIADQSPSAVDISAIRNTNTKIVMRLPEESDRTIAGKSSAMKDDQIDEIAKLPTGVAVVYQNDWEEPILCQINKYDQKASGFQYDKIQDKVVKTSSTELIKFLIYGRTSVELSFDVDKVKEEVETINNISSRKKAMIYESISAYEEKNPVLIWQDSNFETLSSIVSTLLNCNNIMQQISSLNNYNEIDEKISGIIHSQIDIQKDLDKTITQCVLRSMSIYGEHEMDIYKGWIDNVLNTKKI